MPRETHEHTWRKVFWTKPHLLTGTVTDLGLMKSPYPINPWKKGEICDTCEKIILTTGDGLVLRQAITNGFDAFYENPDRPATGIMIDFELITAREERAFR